LIGGLCIIWLVFLLPSRRRSPSSSVEEFEEKMTLLAETHSVSPGRWVLMPRKGERFMGPRDRQRARVTRRRRHLFVALLDLAALTFLMGLFPPFRVMLAGTVVLAVLLLAYSALLVKLRADDALRDRVFRAAVRADAGYGKPNGRTPVRTVRYASGANGAYGGEHRNGHSSGNGGPNGNGHAHANGRSSYGRGDRDHPSNGHASNGIGHRPPSDDYLWGTGVHVIEDDVHVVVYRSGEFELKSPAASE